MFPPHVLLFSVILHCISVIHVLRWYRRKTGRSPSGRPAGRVFCRKGVWKGTAKKIEARRVLNELAEIAFAVPGEEGLPVKMADKLKALELLYKHLGLGEAAAAEAATIIDDIGKEA